MISSERGVEFLLDTNIVIYLSQSDEEISQFIDGMSDRVFGVSVLTYLEALVGIGGPEELSVLDFVFQKFLVLPLTEEIARRSATFLRTREKRSVRDPLFADVIIAQTALSLGIPLVTNNPKDFSRFRELRVLTSKRRR